MENINFTGMTGAQAFRAIDANGGVNDAEISANMEAWARFSFFNQFDDAKLIAAVKKFGSVSASYASTIAGHLQNCTEFDPELISEAAEQLMLQDREVKCMEEKIKTLEAELEAVGAGGVQPVNQHLLKALKSVQSVASASEGIAGWHRNGDLAGWDELLPEIDESIAQAEAQQAQQTQFEPQADDHDRPIETSEGDAREYTKGGAA